jgi:hypothetical protein
MKGWAQIAVQADVHTEVQSLAEQQGTTMGQIVTRAVRMYSEVSAQESALREGDKALT